MKFIITNITTSLLAKKAISIILISLISLSLAAKTGETSSLSFRKTKLSSSTLSSARATTMESIAVKNPVCKEKGILREFLKKGPIAISGKDIKNYVLKLKMPENNQNLKEIWNDYIKPLVTQLPTYSLPSLIVGDFDTKTLKNNDASINAKCSNFPLVKNTNKSMSAVGISLMNVPCGLKPVNIEVCAIFDKCGTFGVSISGGTVACLANLVSAGWASALSPIIEGAAFLQFGYSNNRMWESQVELLQIKSKKELKRAGLKFEEYNQKKTITLKSHLYMGSQISIPKTGLRIRGQDITDFFALKIDGKFFMDLGTKNPLSPENIDKTIRSTSMSNSRKFETFAFAAREYSIQARGSFEINLSGLTQNVFPDVKILDEMDLNVLINLGRSFDGNKGSSGMEPGFHIFFKPPTISAEFNKIVQKVVKMINSWTFFLKLGRFNVPKIPSFKGSEIGISIGKDVRIKVEVKEDKKTVFSMLCIFTTSGSTVKSIKDNFRYDCEYGDEFLSIIKKWGKYHLVRAKAAFGKMKESFMKIDVNSFKDAPATIRDGTIKMYTKMKKDAKFYYNLAKENYPKLKEKYESAKLVLKKAKAGVEKLYKDAKPQLRKFFKRLGIKLKRAAKRFVRDFKKLAKKLAAKLAIKLAQAAADVYNSWFNKKKYKKDIRKRIQAKIYTDAKVIETAALSEEKKSLKDKNAGLRKMRQKKLKYKKAKEELKELKEL